MRAFGYIETQNFEAAEKTAKEVGLGIISSILNYSGMFTHEYICASEPGPRLNIKDRLSRYGDSHVKDKTVGRKSYL